MLFELFQQPWNLEQKVMLHSRPLFVFCSHFFSTNRFSITAVCICLLSVCAVHHPFCSLADLPLSFPWFFVCVSCLNYDLGTDTATLNDLNVSNALYHWSSSIFLWNAKWNLHSKLWLTSVKDHVNLPMKNNVREPFSPEYNFELHVYKLSRTGRISSRGFVK